MKNRGRKFEIIIYNILVPTQNFGTEKMRKHKTGEKKRFQMQHLQTFKLLDGIYGERNTYLLGKSVIYQGGVYA